MNRLIAAAVLSLSLSMGLSACADFQGDPGVFADDVIGRAAQTVSRFSVQDDKAEYRRFLKDAVAVAVFPRIIKGGFIGGAEMGTGVLLARQPDGRWGYPAFYTLGAGSVGFQMGLEDSEMVLIIRTQKGLESVLKHQGKLGAEVQTTIGLFGAGLEGSTTTAMGADIVAYSSSIVGLYGGANIEGAVLARRKDMNRAFYGEDVAPRDIVLGDARNPKADPLRKLIDPRG